MDTLDDRIKLVRESVMYFARRLSAPRSPTADHVRAAADIVVPDYMEWVVAECVSGDFFFEIVQVDDRMPPEPPEISRELAVELMAMLAKVKADRP